MTDQTNTVTICGREVGTSPDEESGEDLQIVLCGFIPKTGLLLFEGNVVFDLYSGYQTQYDEYGTPIDKVDFLPIISPIPIKPGA